MGIFHWSVPMGSAFICRTWGLTSRSINGTNRAFPTEASFSCYSLLNVTDAITAFLHRRDVLVCLLTSSGKCVSFALLPKVVDELKATVGVIPASKYTCRHPCSYQSNGRPSSLFFRNRNTESIAANVAVHACPTGGRLNTEMPLLWMGPTHH